MINIFLCPSVLHSHQLDDPSEFENVHIKCLIQLKNICNKSSKETKILKQSIDRYKSNAPWTKMNDGIWKMYLLEWQLAIFPFLERSMLDIEGATKKECTSLPFLKEVETSAWGYLLDNILAYTTGESIPVVVSQTTCATTKCSDVENTNVDNLGNRLPFILYPWLSVFDSRLPTTGAYPFVPIKDWDKTGSVNKGQKNGWMDVEGNEWVHDTERKNHWDVQFKDGTHRNVSYEGKVI